jgi:hypothetical protein
MANEFIIREGFSSKANVTVTGSLIASSITGSLLTASFAITASYSGNSNTSSFVQTITTASYATTGLSASRASVSNITLNNPASLYAPNGISSSLWNTSFGNNGYISSNFFYTNGNVGQAAAGYRGFYSSSIILTPVYINKTGILSSFAIFGTLLGAPTGSWRVGVYSNSVNMLPETKVFEFDRNVSPTANFRVLYEVTTSVGPTLYQGQIYWLAASTEGAFNNISYTYLQNNPVVNVFIQNKLMNPLLGSDIPILENSIRNIAHYKYPLVSTGSALPSILSQDTGAYIPMSYGVDQGNFGTMHIGPFIKLIY